MGVISKVEIRPLESIQGGMSLFYTPQTSDETMLVKVPAGTVEDLFVHRGQTDQLFVVRGSFVLVLLENRQYRYVPLSDRIPQVITIPRGVPHGAINPTQEDCFLINAVLRHSTPHNRDYQPLRRPFAYDIPQAILSLAQQVFAMK